ncbi:FAD-linked oxidase C-terminal domain-containing protein [Citricoccus nitrophenolicus]|uniref:FAD-linked oxidase C-terminal domain-containing protein n=1 Tax=Citricoccus nitrophenolicus TaxID=863575 RepID=A0ABV0IFT2_9MICC|nr:FAD-linked oxidase C-terminal domain-containing protein [Citricoccus sp. I39-566]WMY77169.1 FAD-linked oxidase C-terminal domain-containing protein [Citricoccus sp. I39-566]
MTPDPGEPYAKDTENTPEQLDLLRAGLAPQLTAGALTTDPDVVSSHARDEAPFAAVGTALALVRARTVQDVQATMRFASEHRIPVVPQGARSGISGGANAVDGCLLLSVERMDRILQIDPAEQTVTVEPGIINQDLKDALAPHGLSYPPDPGSVALSSIGGNLATNAGGLCCVKYGVTRDYVRQVAVVLADGTLTRLGSTTAKGVAGLDLCGLFVGSEGTLGIIVEATLRLVPRLPPPLTAVATFPHARAAAQTVAEFMGGGARPSMMESLDRASIDLLNRFGDFGLDSQAGALLLMQSDGDGTAAEAAREVAAFAAVAERLGALDVAFSEDPEDSDALVAARRLAQPAFERYSRDHGGGQLLDDVCLPRTAIPEFYDRLDALRARTGLMIAVVAHAGDGNVHPSVFFDTADEASVRRAHEAFDEIMAVGLELGGTITGEHGVGSLKSAWLARELDEGSRRLHRCVKDAIDPLGILNPGKQFAAL